MNWCQKCHDDIAVANVSYPTMGSPLTKLDMCPVCTLRIIGRVELTAGQAEDLVDALNEGIKELPEEG